MNIYLTRHGESQWNVEERLQGSFDSCLTKKGKIESHKLRHYLNESEINIDLIYTSPSLRALETAEIIAKNKRVSSVKHPSLKEMDVGLWHGQTWTEIQQKYPQEYQRYWHQPHLYQATHGGEDFNQVQKRATTFLQNVIQNDNHSNILIVSHGVILNSILNYVEKQPLNNFWEQPLVVNNSLSLLKVTDEQAELLYRNKQIYLDC